MSDEEVLYAELEKALKEMADNFGELVTEGSATSYVVALPFYTFELRVSRS